MSVESIAIALHHSRAAGTEKLVLVGVANHDGDGGAWPTVATLAKYAGRSERQVQTCLRRLEELGEIVTHLNAGGSAHLPDYERPNLYEFILGCPDECDRTKHHRLPGDTGYGVKHTSPGGVKRTSPVRVKPTSPAPVKPTSPRGVKPASPEPSFEPSIEPINPPAPLSRAASSCSTHPVAVDGCRGCGTAPRQRRREADRQAAQAARTAERADLARQHQLELALAASAEVRTRVAEQARHAIAANRGR